VRVLFDHEVLPAHVPLRACVGHFVTTSVLWRKPSGELQFCGQAMSVVACGLYGDGGGRHGDGGDRTGPQRSFARASAGSRLRNARSGRRHAAPSLSRDSTRPLSPGAIATLTGNQTSDAIAGAQRGSTRSAHGRAGTWIGTRTWRVLHDVDSLACPCVEARVRSRL